MYYVNRYEGKTNLLSFTSDLGFANLEKICKRKLLLSMVLILKT